MSTDNLPIRHIVVLGGGAVGWSCAVAISRALVNRAVKVTVIPSHTAYEPNVIAACETITDFHAQAGIKAESLYKSRVAQPWLARQIQTPSGPVFLGNEQELPRFASLDVHHLLSYFNEAELSDLSLSATAAKQNIFAMPTSKSAAYRLGLLIHTVGYAEFMRAAASHLGIQCVNSTVQSCELDERQRVKQITCSDGTRLPVDLLIDNSDGTLPALSSEKTNDTCSIFASVRSSKRSPSVSFGADSWGDWQHAQGVGFDQYQRQVNAEDAAAASMHWRETLGDEVNIDVVDHFVRQDSLEANCLRIGALAGADELLAQDRLSRAHRTIATLIDYFPGTAFPEENSKALNSVIAIQTQQAKDYRLAIHSLAAGTLPDQANVNATLQRRLDLFASSARLTNELNPLITRTMWMQALWYLYRTEAPYDPLTMALDAESAKTFVRQCVMSTEQILASFRSG